MGGRGQGFFVACPAGFSSFCDSLFSPKIGGGGGCPPGPTPKSATGLTNSMMIGASPLWAYDWSVSFSKMISLRQYVRVTLSSAVASMDHSTCPVFSKLCSESQDYFDRSRWASISGGLRLTSRVFLRASAVVPIYPTNLFEVIKTHASSRGVLMKLHLSFGLSPPQEKLSQSMWWNCADRARMLMRTSQKLS